LAFSFDEGKSERINAPSLSVGCEHRMDSCELTVDVHSPSRICTLYAPDDSIPPYYFSLGTSSPTAAVASLSFWIASLTASIRLLYPSGSSMMTTPFSTCTRRDGSAAKR